MRAVLSFAAPQQVMPMAKEAALKALAIDETVADAHFVLAFVLDFFGFLTQMYARFWNDLADHASASR